MSSSSTHESSPTSYGVSPVPLILDGDLGATYHRKTLSTSSITTPVFSHADLKEDDRVSLRTLDNVRDQVAAHVAVRLMRKLKTADNTQYGVALTLSKSDDGAFLRLVASHLAGRPAGPGLKEKPYLVAVATTGTGDSSLLICGTDAAKVQRAALLTTSKFIGYIKPLPSGSDLNQDDDDVSGSATATARTSMDGGTVWLGRVRGLGWNGYDEAALWDVLQKCAQELVDPSRPPPGSRGVDELIATARTRLHRLLPRQALGELRDADIRVPVLLVDIRPPAYRAKYGQIPGAIVVERMLLEWRFDPRCVEERLDIATRYDLRVIVICQEGLASSMAAATLQDIGLLNATDVVGGFMAWKAEGLPVELES
jgi:rhodanese-related sulfurtransferase